MASIQEITMTVRGTQESGYQFKLDGAQWPARVVSVSSSSHGYCAGLRAGDFLLTVNGRDVIHSPVAQVEAIMSYSSGSPLTLKVARVAVRGGAVAAVQRKYQDGVNPVKKSNRSEGFKAYQAALGSAVESAQSAMDILGLSSDSPVPKVTVSTGTEQEVEVSMHNDSDLSTPSETSEQSDKDYDPLLDFSHGTDSYSLASADHEVNRADMVGSVLRANQALREFKSITESLANKSKPSSSPAKVVTEATIRVGSKPHPPPSSTSAPVVSTTAPMASKSAPVVSTNVPVSSAGVPVPSANIPVPSSQSHDRRGVQEASDRESSSPPPVPPYTPSSPDKFPLSNKPDYQLEFKRQRHAYEDVELLGQDVQDKTTPPAPPPVTFRVKTKATKIKGDGSHDQLPARYTSRNMAVEEPSRKQRSFAPGDKLPAEATASNKSLPDNVHSWKPENVNRWLKQSSPAMFKLYSTSFAEHKITGHSLLMMTQSKLTSLGITNKEHRVQLAAAIARLRLKQEKTELAEMSKDVAWL